MSCTECRELLGGHVLDALEPAEDAAVRAHLAECAACAQEAERLAPVPLLLDLAGPAEAAHEPPPPALEDTILARHAREHRSTPRVRWRMPRLRWPWRLPRRAGLAVAGAVAAAAIGVAVATLAGVGDDAAPPVYRAQLHGLVAEPGARAQAVLTERPVGTTVRLRVHGLEPGRTYELWCVSDDGARITAGTFRAGRDGGARVQLTSAAELDEYRHLRVSEERGGPGYGTDVLAGLIRT